MNVHSQIDKKIEKWLYLVVFWWFLARNKGCFGCTLVGDRGRGAGNRKLLDCP